jgi:hypothetical protein
MVWIAPFTKKPSSTPPHLARERVVLWRGGPFGGHFGRPE